MELRWWVRTELLTMTLTPLQHRENEGSDSRLDSHLREYEREQAVPPEGDPDVDQSVRQLNICLPLNSKWLNALLLHALA